MNYLEYPKSSFVKDLCDYYNVDQEKAITLGTRSNGRRPDLPSSKTCSAVSGKTFEDIWDEKARVSNADIFDFYRDQGAWSSFRQVIRHNDLVVLHVNLIKFLLHCTQSKSPVILEYGCGVAPFSRTLVEFIDPSAEIDIYISDVEGCEHLCFGEWRLRNKVKERELNVKVDARPITHDTLPVYDKNIDVVFIFEVLEHVPNPVECIKNIANHMNVGALLVENFIKHEDDHDQDGPDLLSARLERDEYYRFLNDKFSLVSGENHLSSPNETRIWRKKFENLF